MATSRSERAFGVLRRVLDLAVTVLRALRRLAVVVAVVAVAAWASWLLDAPPADPTAWATAVVILAIALAPAVVLFVVIAALDDLRELPQRYRDLPEDVRERARRFGREERVRHGAVRSLVELGRLVIASRELLSPYALVTAALRPAILGVAALAALAAALEVVIGLVLAAWFVAR